MEPLILDKEFNSLSILDTFESFLWVERYSSYGDFEIYTAPTKELLDVLKLDHYLWLKDSDQVMIIEEVSLESDVEMGNRATISGRSLESILDRRIIWNQISLDGYLQGQIKRLLDANAISPTDESRKIPNLIFEETDDPTITALKVNAQFTGDNLYDAIKSICDTCGIGFRITLSDSGMMVFKLYNGVDRSYNQTDNPYVIFSPNFDNIVSSNFLESKKTLKNVTLVAGEGEGSSRRTLEVNRGDVKTSGLDRREMYTDARDISSKVDDKTLTADEYNAQLKQRGLEKLSDYTKVELFDGQADHHRMYEYGKDYYKGDIVQIANEYGFESSSRITEIIRSQSPDGLLIYPTFETIEEKGDDIS